jgi:hypothetical protein
LCRDDTELWVLDESDLKGGCTPLALVECGMEPTWIPRPGPVKDDKASPALPTDSDLNGGDERHRIRFALGDVIPLRMALLRGCKPS